MTDFDAQVHAGASAARDAHGAHGADNTATGANVGIIGAMEVEVASLVDAMENRQTAKHAGMTFHEGAIGTTHCVVVQCNVGMVNAAVCTQLLIDRFGVTHVVNTGVAGSLDATIDIGDIIVARDAINHLMDVCNLGYEPGQTPGMDALAFPCDDLLRKRIADAVQEATCVAAHEKRIASGDRFVRDAGEKTRIAQVFDAACCEMEGAAVAQTCLVNGVPCAIVRAISDKADGSDALDYPAFEARAAADCAAVVKKLLESWE